MTILACVIGNLAKTNKGALCVVADQIEWIIWYWRINASHPDTLGEGVHVRVPGPIPFAFYTYTVISLSTTTVVTVLTVTKLLSQAA